MPAFAQRISRVCLVSAAAFATWVAAQPGLAQSANTTFFVTSNGPGKGADLGGIEGADKQCQTLGKVTTVTNVDTGLKLNGIRKRQVLDEAVDELGRFTIGATLFTLKVVV